MCLGDPGNDVRIPRRPHGCRCGGWRIASGEPLRDDTRDEIARVFWHPLPDPCRPFASLSVRLRVRRETLVDISEGPDTNARASGSFASLKAAAKRSEVRPLRWPIRTFPGAQEHNLLIIGRRGEEVGPLRDDDPPLLEKVRPDVSLNRRVADLVREGTFQDRVRRRGGFATPIAERGPEAVYGRALDFMRFSTALGHVRQRRAPQAGEHQGAGLILGLLAAAAAWSGRRQSLHQRAAPMIPVGLHSLGWDRPELPVEVAPLRQAHLVLT